jgi:hypothetical protein
MKRQASVGMLYLKTVLIFSLLFALVHLTSCASTVHCDAYGDVKWEDSIENPANDEYIVEVAFNEGISVDQVTQEMFNARYGVE